jgi:hypothetical protein
MDYPNQLRTIRRLQNEPSEISDGLACHFRLHSHDLKNTRDLRTLLLDAAYELQNKADFTDAHIYLHNCTLAKKRVEMEVEQFKRIALPHIGQRITLHDSRFNTVLEASLAVGFEPDVREHSRKPTTASQEAVMVYLLQRHLQSLPGISINTIAAQTKASLPTIYKVLNTYDHCIERDLEDKTLRLRYFASNDWLYWIQRTNQLSSVYFIDRSGSPRSTNRLAKELTRLQREDLAIGGLMGARHHLPALDATSSPQLDILVHCTRRSDLSFVTKLDPGLERYDGRADMANVVIHFIDRPTSLFVHEDGQNWGTLPDCIANIQRSGLDHQVSDALQLVKRGNKP